MKKLRDAGLFLAMFTATVLAAHFLIEHGTDYPFFRGGTVTLAADWSRAFQPAALAFLAGKSPYSVPLFFCPPWVLIPLVPLALLPTAWGTAILYAGNLTGYIVLSQRLRVHPAITVAFMAWLIANSLLGNIEGTLLLGFILPPPIGLFFALAKPQAGIIVALFWLAEAWRTGGAWRVVRVFAPVTICLFLSFVAYGLWPLNATHLPAIAWWNVSVFPWGIPVGLALAALALWKRNLKFAIAAAPWLSPYVGMTWNLTYFLAGDTRRKE